MLILGLVLLFCAGGPQMQAQALNIANGASASSSLFRAALTSTSTTTTTTEAPSTPVFTTASTVPSTTTTTVPFTVSPTPFSPIAAVGTIDTRTGKRIQMANTPFIRLNRMNTGSRTNSRFLRTFPPLEYLEFARRDSLAKHGLHRPASAAMSMHDQMTMIHGIGHAGMSGSDEDFRFEDDSSGYDHDGLHSNQLGNSPIFYIKLPPAPYVLVPGLGYVSPHPYQNSNNLLPGAGSGPSAGSHPMMMSPLGAFDFGSSHDGPSPLSSSSSSSSSANNVISLPLKFVSNARPAIIVGAKPGVDNGIHGDDKDSGKHTTLLSGGKYSFNGRPNGVFIVRSPAVSRTLNRRQRQPPPRPQQQRQYAIRST